MKLLLHGARGVMGRNVIDLAKNTEDCEISCGVDAHAEGADLGFPVYEDIFKVKEDFDVYEIDIASIDVSFISLSLILPNLAEIIKDGGEVCALVKPQFEAGKDKVGKGGIVRDKKVQLEVVEKVLLLANSVGFSMTNLSYSPITGGEGNIEFLMTLKYNATKEVENKNINIEHIVNNAHNHFK